MDGKTHKTQPMKIYTELKFVTRLIAFRDLAKFETEAKYKKKTKNARAANCVYVYVWIYENRA